MNKVDPYGLCDDDFLIFLGLYGNAFIGPGVTAGIGLFISTTPPYLGLYGTGGAGGGYDVSASVDGGFVKGGTANFEGQSLNWNGGAGPLGGSVSQNGDIKGPITGGSGGVGVGLFPGSGTVTGTRTGIIPLVLPAPEKPSFMWAVGTSGGLSK